MPDLISIGLGGGSLVVAEGGKAKVGPRSVGYRITTEAMVFGGSQLTATDIAVAAGYADVGDKARVAKLDRKLVGAAVDEIGDRSPGGVLDARKILARHTRRSYPAAARTA